jgi:UDP-glucose 4-epimerase
MKRVLVTGASGYIGQHLINSLAREGVTVRGFSRGPRPAVVSPIEWQQGDVCQLSQVQQAIQGCDIVIHLACLPFSSSFQNPLADFQVNALGTLNVVLAAQAAKIRRLINISTAQVYGKAARLPIKEEDQVQPVSPYGASKLSGEIVCTTFTRCYDLDTVTLRLFNVYGLPVDQSARKTVEAIFVNRVSKGLPPVIKGDPNQGRDFIHISDVVRAILLASERGQPGAVINIGSGKMTTLLELARLAIELGDVEKEPIVEQTEAPSISLQADIIKAKEILGFEAEILLQEGLTRLFEAANSLN